MVMSTGLVNAQITPYIEKVSITGIDKTILDQHISKYTAFIIDKQELTENIHANGGVSKVRLRIDENLDWTIDFELNDMRAPDYRATYTTDAGIFEIKDPFVVNTYKGKTSDGHVARFTIDENYFFGVILGNDYHYVIRPIEDYTQNKENQNFIVYKNWDIISYEHDIDYINDALTMPGDNVWTDMTGDSGYTTSSTTSTCIYYLQIGTDADFEFHQARGGSSGSLPTPTNNYIISILNIAEGVYESTFGMRFGITWQNVYITSSSQPYTSTDPVTLWNQFRNQWNANCTAVLRNIAHLFTGKNLDGKTLGISWKGAINGNIANNNAYSLSKHDTNMQYTVVHEIGHNLDASENPAGTGCDCNKTQRSVMCQGSNLISVRFCTQSQNEINNFINNNNAFISSICGPSLVCYTSSAFTLNNPPSGSVTWHKSSNISLSGYGNSVTATAISNGAGWISVNVNSVEFFKWPVWVGAPIISYISVPTPVYAGQSKSYEAILSSKLSVPSSYDWSLSPMNWSYLNNYGYWANINISPSGYYTVQSRATNACGTGPYTNLFVSVYDYSPSPPYPNPVSDVLNIETGTSASVKVQGTSITYDVRLYNDQGNLLRQAKNKGGTVQFNVSALPDGIYFLHIYDGVSSTPEIQQIVVQH